VASENKVNRNDPCPCGSGKKYKQCHLGKVTEEDQQVVRRHWRVPIILAAIALIVSISVGLSTELSNGGIVFVSALLFIGGFVVLRKPPPPTGNSRDGGAINFGR
jgi:hypothetical protein